MLLLKAAPERLLLNAGYQHHIQCAGHLYASLSPDTRRETVKQVIRCLSPLDFDAIAIRGLSGLLIAPIVAMEMNKTLLVVRKPDEKCHSSKRIEGDYNTRRYVILDDFISSGSTVYAIYDEIKERLPSAHCIGVFEYNLVSEYSEAGNPSLEWTKISERDERSESAKFIAEKIPGEVTW